MADTVLNGIRKDLGMAGQGLMQAGDAPDLYTMLTGIAKRLGDPVADETALAAIAAADRYDKQIVLVGANLWYRDDSSAAVASAGSVVTSTDSATGRWLILDSDATLKALLASTANGKGASMVGIEDSGAKYTATTVEGALAEVKTIADAAVGIVKRSVTIGFADFAGLGAGVKTYDANVGAALPANARFWCAELSGFTGFDDATHGTYTIVCGTSAGGNELGTSTNIAAGQSGFPKNMTAGAQGYTLAPQSAAQAQVRITGGVDLNTATAGAVTVNVFYTVLA